MKAIRLHQYGPPKNLRLETLPDLVPGAGQVRIAVAVAGMQLADAAGAQTAMVLRRTVGKTVLHP